MANAPQPTLRLDEAGEPRRLGPQPRLRRWRARLTALFWFILIVLVLGPFIREHPYQTVAGQIAQTTYLAPRNFEVIDREAMRQAVQQFRETQVWIRDTKAEESAQQKLRIFFDELSKQDDQLRHNIEAAEGFVGTMRERHEIATNVGMVQAFLGAPMPLGAIQRELRLTLNDVLFNRYIVTNINQYQAQHGAGTIRLMSGDTEQKNLPKPNAVINWPDHARSEIGIQIDTRFPAETDRALRQASVDLLMSILQPNIVYDAAATRRVNATALAAIKAETKTRKFNRDETIVEQGQKITEIQAEALSLLEDQRHEMMARKLFGLTLMAAIFFGAIAVYLKRFRRDTTLDASTITLHVLPPLVALIVGQLLLVWHGSQPAYVITWFPAALVGMLTSLLITPQVAFVLILSTACLFGFAAGRDLQGLDLQFMILTLFGGFTAVLTSRNIRTRLDILRVGIKVGIVNMVALTMMALANPDWLSSDTGKGALGLYQWLLLSGFLNGIACAMATLFLLLVFEWAFGIVTDLRLLELTGMKHPLIRQLETKAPGTYEHTMNVVKLAEAASEAIGANTLLVRAGTYFHDIGKMVKPKYFSENQVTLDDKKAHARLSPYMSVLIIKNHVKEGQELAREFGLPQKIIDFIPQHHGTGLIRYFHQQALNRYENSEAVDPVREEDFRYPGPKPQSIETALVLLADSVDAISHSRFIGGQVNESELRRTVQYAISEKFNDGQFDECNLTMSHLYRIREALVAALMARYHFRVSYPTPPRPTRDASAAAAQISVTGPSGS